MEGVGLMEQKQGIAIVFCLNPRLTESLNIIK